MERRNKHLERTKRQLEKENVSALYETSKLRQQLQKKKRVLAKERSENARKTLEIDLLRNDNRAAHQNLNESNTALKEAQERCWELENSLRSQNGTIHTAQDQDAGDSLPITEY
jgi:Fe2+ transport system protein B